MNIFQRPVADTEVGTYARFYFGYGLDQIYDLSHLKGRVLNVVDHGNKKGSDFNVFVSFFGLPYNDAF